MNDTAAVAGNPLAAAARYAEPLAFAWEVGRPQRAVYELVQRGQIAAGARVLEVGCGAGEHALWLAARGHVTCGVDPSAAAIARAQRRAKREGIDGRASFVVADLVGLTGVAVDGKFDCALDAGSFHRVPVAERRAYARGLARVVRPGGSAFVLCFSERERGRGGPPRVTQAELVDAFATAAAVDGGWRVEAVEESVLESRLFPGGAAAWLLRAVRG